MLTLVQRSPATIDFDELCVLTHARLGTDDAAKEDERNALAFDLLQSFGAGVVELHLLPSAFVIDAGPRPEASASRGCRRVAARKSPTCVTSGSPSTTKRGGCSLC